MLRLRKVAITGGLSCGKSSVCRFFEKFGAYVVSADDIVHQLLSPHTITGQKVIQLIGNDIIIDHQISRSKIAEKVFNQPSLLRSLENILHPAVQNEVERLFKEAENQGKGTLFVAEIPLLFEAGKTEFYDTVIAVVAEPEKSEQRFKLATGYGTSEYEKRSARQLKVEEKAAKADYIIVNNETLDELEIKIKNMMNILNK